MENENTGDEDMECIEEEAAAPQKKTATKIMVKKTVVKVKRGTKSTRLSLSESCSIHRAAAKRMPATSAPGQSSHCIIVDQEVKEEPGAVTPNAVEVPEATEPATPPGAYLRTGCVLAIRSHRRVATEGGVLYKAEVAERQRY